MHFIDVLNISDIRRYKQRMEAILDYHYQHYTFFQQERDKRLPAIKEAIMNASQSFSFTSWHRIFAYQFWNNPLSSKGSILNDPGGRFNVGDINELKFPKFPALYIAENFEVAYRERNQISPSQKNDSGLSTNDLVLTNTNSTIDLLIEGHIISTIDLSNPNTLKNFYEIIKPIKLPKDLEKKAKMLNIPIMYHVNSYEELLNSILLDNWRELPMQLDIPSNSQIFGQLAHAAGIEGIIYPSKMSEAKKCIAVFPKNFENSNSCVGIQDKENLGNIKNIELNSETWSDLF